jgi:acyl carrier protein
MTHTQTLEPASASLSPLEHELAVLIIKAVNLEDVRPEHIDPGAPLIGDGLGLDSIDALEISLAVAKQYGFQLHTDDEDSTRETFASLRALAHLVEQNRTK